MKAKSQSLQQLVCSSFNHIHLLSLFLLFPLSQTYTDKLTALHFIKRKLFVKLALVTHVDSLPDPPFFQNHSLESLT